MTNTEFAGRRPITRSQTKKEIITRSSAAPKKEIIRRSSAAQKKKEKKRVAIVYKDRGGSMKTVFRFLEEKRLAKLKLKLVQSRNGSEYYFAGTQEEFTDMEDDYHICCYGTVPSPCKEDEEEHTRLECHEFFQDVKDRCREMADYELDAHKGVAHIHAAHPLVHVNLKLKHKDEDDSSAALYFVELNFNTKERVTCIKKLKPDLGPSEFGRCKYCNHFKVQLEYVSRTEEDVYHPPEGGYCGVMNDN